MKTCLVYLLTFANGKQYVGVSSRLKQRLQEHGRSKQSLVGRAMGQHSWTCEVLFTGTVSDCLVEEVLTVERLQTKHPHGYNLTAGGEGSLDLDPQVKKRLSEATRIRMTDPGSKAIIAEGNRKRWSDPEKRLEQSKLMSRRYSDVAEREKQSARLRTAVTTEERKRRSEQMRKQWSDPAFVLIMKRTKA